MVKRNLFAGATALTIAFSAAATAETATMDYQDIFNLEYATGAQLAPDGKSVVYERRSMDIMTDSTRSNIWSVTLDGAKHTPVLSGKASYRMPRFSPDGTRMAYVSAVEGKTQIYVRWLDSGQTARVTDLQMAPSSLSWSPDSRHIAFSMFVPGKQTSLFTLPPKPKGATWAGNAKVIDSVTYRRDGSGYVPTGFSHVFVVPADGGTPRQVTSGDFHHRGSIGWLADNKTIVLSANRSEDWEYETDSEIYAVDTLTGDYRALTDRKGPDAAPIVSKDGSKIAYLGFDDTLMSSQNANLYVMNADGSSKRSLTDDLDRGVSGIEWSLDGRGIYYSYDDHGKTLVAYASTAGSSRIITNQVGGTSLGRPYTSGDFTVAGDSRIVFTQNRTDRPADLAVVDRIGRVTPLTSLNEDVFAHKKMAAISEITFKSSHDGRDLQFWIATPPDFDPSKKYPLLLEIHGGPHSAYGPTFSAEVQMYAAKGYVVVYGNPRGSTSYGAEFANLIHHNYPSEDYNDLIDAVDQVVAKGYIDEDQLYVTGGSGGGVLTAWIVGNTDRFRAAVVAKPVINWASFSLTADGAPYFTKYWFPDMPWNIPDHYWKRSPLSLVGNVSTPTMLLTGEVDYRTPMSETEQYYQALKLRKIDTAMVRIPGASHGIYAKPSNLVQKIGNILAWFDKYKGAE
ncbi:acyl-peptide hydrolase [Kordiimonas sediminis]|uniref:Acyl-peptide hydrolase n=1 Tax=Kordiimonas sediminis TaxID=1735581 RepID=A0A919AN45_9PROT|nr:S9 family peptidase [Kordiimonas sediminis]GHF16513.1 acyl-peptide hydrolase [Kordiimonas sediminis]